MKTAFDTYLKIQGLKQHKPKKAILYWQALWNGACIDEHANVAILKARYGSNCTYKPVR